MARCRRRRPPRQTGAAARSKPTRLLLPALVVAVLVVLGLFLPALLRSTFYIGLLVNAIVLGIAAVSIGLLAHQCGLMMFGAAAFTGGSTYLFAIGVNSFGMSAMGAAGFALLASTVLSALIGALVVRARPLPFAMLTLALAQMLRSMVMITDFRPVTGGDDGLALTFAGGFFGLTQSQLAKPEGFWPVAWLALWRRHAAGLGARPFAHRPRAALDPGQRGTDALLRLQHLWPAGAGLHRGRLHRRGGRAC